MGDDKTIKEIIAEVDTDNVSCVNMLTCFHIPSSPFEFLHGVISPIYITDLCTHSEVNSREINCTRVKLWYKCTQYIFTSVRTEIAKVLIVMFYLCPGRKNQLPGVRCYDEKQQPWDCSKSETHVLNFSAVSKLILPRHLRGPIISEKHFWGVCYFHAIVPHLFFWRVSSIICCTEYAVIIYLLPLDHLLEHIHCKTAFNDNIKQDFYSGRTQPKFSSEFASCEMLLLFLRGVNMVITLCV